MGTPIKALNNVRVTSTTRGTGALQLSVAPAAGYQHPNNALAQTGDRGGWMIQSQNRLVWELVEGVLTQGTPWTLARVRYVANSTGVVNQPINWQDEHGVLTITATTIADRLPLLDTDGRFDRAALSPPKFANLHCAETYQLPSETIVQVPFNTLEFDTDAMAVPSGGAYVGFNIRTAGVYDMRLDFRFAFNTTGVRIAEIRYIPPNGGNTYVVLSGNQVRTDTFPGPVFVGVTARRFLPAGTAIYAAATQNSGQALTMGGFFGLELING